MGVIAKPNKEGQECDVRQHTIHIPTNYDRTMPNFPNYRLGPLDGSICDTLGIDNHPIAKFRYETDPAAYLRLEFFDLSYFRPEKWAWDFGDGITSDKQELEHVFEKNGTYNVCLTVSNENSSNTACRLITIGPSAIANDDFNKSNVVSVFPNPTEGDILLTMSEYIPEKGEVFFYDESGKEVLNQRVYYGWNNLNLTILPKGIYGYIVKDKNVKLGIGKLVKIK
jgi:PKD repeat protein